MAPPSLTDDVMRVAPLGGGALYLNFVSTYGAAILTTLGILYALSQFYWRWREHNKIMGGNNGNSN